MTQSADITPGRYRHYKGKDYEVLGTATHSETDERMVLYRCLYGNFDLWVRPLASFSETVEVGGKCVPRYALVAAKPTGASDG